MSSGRSFLDGVRGMRPSAEKVGSVGSSGLELASVRVGDSAVHSVCAGDTTVRSSDGSFPSPKCCAATGGDEGNTSEDAELLRACINCTEQHASDMGRRGF